MASFTVSQLTDLGNADVVASLATMLQQQLSATASQALIECAIQSQNTMVFTACDDTMAVIGTATAAMTPCPTGTRVHIEDVLVDTEWRGKGVATKLLLTAINQAQSVWNPKSIDLTSRPSRTDANALYQKLGFTQRETNVYRYNGTK